MDTVKVEFQNNVAVVILDLPDSKYNLLSARVMSDLDAAIDQVAAHPGVLGLVIKSGKDDNFVVGADIKEIQALQSQSPVEAYKASQLGKKVLQKIEDLPFPTVAAIHGLSLGGGTELTLACKRRIASNDRKTRIGLPEVQLGFVPGWGGTVRMPRLVGLMNAMALVVQTSQVEAKKAWRMGLVDEVVDKSALYSRAIELALGKKPNVYRQPIKEKATRSLLENNPAGRAIFARMVTKQIYASTRGNYPAPLEALKVMMLAFSGTRDKALEAESQAFARLATGEVSCNIVGIWAAEQESKKAPEGASCGCDIRTVGVLGAGVMGAGIAQAAAYAGYKVVLYDKFEKSLENGMARIKGLFDGLVEKRKLTRDQADQMVANVTTTHGYDAFAACDFVIEAVLEDLAVKKEALSQLEKVIGNDCFIFASNTSSLSITAMAEGSRKPSNVVGVHFFNPVHKMKLTEVVRGQATSSDAVACGMEFASRLGKITVVTSDSPGFVVNRILTPYMREAILLLEQGVPPEDIEKAIKYFGFPMGPLEVIDEVGLDIAAKVIHSLNTSLPGGARLASPAILSTIEKLKLMGKKGGKGIFLYDEKGKRAGFNPDVLAAVTAKANPKSRGEIQERLVLLMVNEAARCMEEGVVDSASQLDLAMVYGCGFPPFRGGVLRYADKQGIPLIVQKLDLLCRVLGENYRPAKILVKMAAEGGTFYQH